jgi:hypothetical protein
VGTLLEGTTVGDALGDVGDVVGDEVSLKSGQIISVVDSMKQITSLEQFVKQS